MTETIGHVVLSKRTPIGWFLGFFIAFMLLMVLNMTIGNLLMTGIGIWGNNVPVGWAFDIINFVWWIGIGHAGTLISAILLLFRQQWRTSINRFAEAMTLFAVACAAMYPAAPHRPAVAGRVLAVPVSEHDGPVAAVPQPADLGRVRGVDLRHGVGALLVYRTRARHGHAARSRQVARSRGASTACWRSAGAARPSTGSDYETAYLLLAGISTPLVLSVHSVVSFDFAVSVLPGWHATIFPPYFVAGAIYSGFAMVMTLAIPLRKFYHLEDFITMRHIHNMTKVMLVTGMIVAYGYANEVFFAWYSANPYESFMMYNRMTGPYAVFYWSLIAINVVMIQLFWFRSVRDNIPLLFILSLFVNVGMWLERFIIIVTSLHRDFLPSSWDMYAPTRWDFGMFARHDRLVPGALLPLHPLPAGDRHLRDANDRPGSQAEGGTPRVR